MKPRFLANDLPHANGKHKPKRKPADVYKPERARLGIDSKSGIENVWERNPSLLSYLYTSLCVPTNEGK